MLRWRLSVLLLLVLAKPAAAHAPPPARPHPPPPPFSLLGSFETAFAGEAVSLLSPSQLACVEVVALQARAAASAAPHTRGGAHRLQLSHATCADCGAVGYCPTASGKKGASLVTVRRQNNLLTQTRTQGCRRWGVHARLLPLRLRRNSSLTHSLPHAPATPSPRSASGPNAPT